MKANFKEIEMAISNERKRELCEIIEELKKERRETEKTLKVWSELNEEQPNEKNRNYIEFYKGIKNGLTEAILIIEEHAFLK